MVFLHAKDAIIIMRGNKMDEELTGLASQLGAILIHKGLSVTTAESCTSGWVGASLAAVNESSRFYTSGFITYSDRSKQRVLGVSLTTLNRYSAVSEAAVSEMACGAKKITGDDIGLAVSGYAGPQGGDDGTPAGTIWFAWCLQDESVHTCKRVFDGEAEEVVRNAVKFSLCELSRLLEE